MNALLAAVSVALVAEIGLALFGRAVGAAAGLLAAISPVVLARMIPPMTEALTIALLLLATWIVVRAPEPARRRDYLLAGLALGLGYLARPTVAALVLAMLPAIVLAAHDRRGALRAIGWLIVGVLVFAVPISLYSLAAQGSLSYSGQSYLYAVHKDSDVLRNGYGRPLPTPAEFISSNLDFVLVAMLENVRDYANLLLLDRDWLRPLLPAWIGVLLALVWRRVSAPGHHPGRAGPGELLHLRPDLGQLPGAVPASDAAAPAPVPGGRPRVARPDPPAARAAAARVCRCSWPSWSSAGGGCPTWRHQYQDEYRYGDEEVEPRVDDGLRWTGPPRWSEDPELARINAWLRANTDRDDVVTHGQPWPYTFFTMRPATLMPTKLEPDRLRTFLTEYRVAYVLLDQRDRDRRDYRADLEALARRWRQRDHGRQLPHLRHARPLAIGRARVGDSSEPASVRYTGLKSERRYSMLPAVLTGAPSQRERRPQAPPPSGGAGSWQIRVPPRR